MCAPISKCNNRSAYFKIVFKMKINHGDQEEGISLLSRPTVDVRAIIYGLTSSDCTSAHPGVTNGDQDEPQDIVEKVEGR
jgi:hypothetical protein